MKRDINVVRNFKGKEPFVSLNVVFAKRHEILSFIGASECDRYRDYELQDRMIDYGFIVSIKELCPINNFSCGHKTIKDVYSWIEDNYMDVENDWVVSVYKNTKDANIGDKI